MEELKCNKMCEMLQKAYGKSAMKKNEWYKRFQDGRKDVGRTSIIDKNVKKSGKNGYELSPNHNKRS
jgi:hypothetical protein